MDDRTVWLECNISSGQFSSELAVSAVDYIGSEFSLFTNQENVEFDANQLLERGETEGRMRVVILDENKDLSLVRLPARTFENGSTVTVKKSQLETREPSRI